MIFWVCVDNLNCNPNCNHSPTLSQILGFDDPTFDVPGFLGLLATQRRNQQEQAQLLLCYPIVLRMTYGIVANYQTKIGSGYRLTNGWYA